MHAPHKIKGLNVTKKGTGHEQDPRRGSGPGRSIDLAKVMGKGPVQDRGSVQEFGDPAFVLAAGSCSRTGPCSIARVSTTCPMSPRRTRGSAGKEMEQT